MKNILNNKLNIGVFLFLCLVLSLSTIYAQEQLDIVTYYPSPYGSYQELSTRNLTWGCGNSRAELKEFGGGSINLGGLDNCAGGDPTPEIEFKNYNAGRGYASFRFHDDGVFLAQRFGNLTFEGGPGNAYLSESDDGTSKIIGSSAICVNYDQHFAAGGAAIVPTPCSRAASATHSGFFHAATHPALRGTYYAIACGMDSCGLNGAVVATSAFYLPDSDIDWQYSCPQNGHMICVRAAD
jgi:hypothetical protein